MTSEQLFAKVEKYRAPSSIIFRSIEIKLLRERMGRFFKDKKILDLGCGDGTATSAIFDQKIDFGLDNFPQAIEPAKKSQAFNEVIFSEAAEIPLADGSLGLVFSNCSIEHIKDLEPVFKEILRVLEKDGIFAFTSLSNNFENYSLLNFLKLKPLGKFYGRLRDSRQHHYHTHSLEDWSLKLKQAGFEVIDGYYYLSKRDIELWDLLTILYYCWYFIDMASPKLADWLYRTLVRKEIFKRFLAAEIADSGGAAVGIIAKKSQTR